ncbi:MAG: hypothetical protein OEV15_07135, partial [Gallionella sp.]|nr:hypothetical protein [Gallionella sp.]
MIKTTVFMVTRLGESMLAKPQGRITGDARLLAGLIDGQASVAEITDKVPPSVRVHLADIFTRLLNYGVISEKGGDQSGHELINPQQHVEYPPEQAQPVGQSLGEQALSSNNADIENRRRIELEKELSEVRLKLDS